MTDIYSGPTASDALVRIYGGRCVLSSRACRLLGLSPQGGRVRIRQDMEQYERGGRVRLYISRCSFPYGYEVKRRNRVGQINSSSLSHNLADKLEGYGTYRICEEVNLWDGDEICYEIFFKKYR